MAGLYRVRCRYAAVEPPVLLYRDESGMPDRPVAMHILSIHSCSRMNLIRIKEPVS